MPLVLLHQRLIKSLKICFKHIINDKKKITLKPI